MGSASAAIVTGVSLSVLGILACCFLPILGVCLLLAGVTTTLAGILFLLYHRRPRPAEGNAV
jgi:hypothetical protein